MTIIDKHGVELLIPPSVKDHQSFRAWALGPDFPKNAKIWWIKDQIWIDLSMEQIFTHNLLKTKLAVGLTVLVEELGLGMVLGDGALLSNMDATITGEPEGMFIATETMTSDRLRFIEGQKGGYVEVQGTPDMVLEVLSPSSRTKDQVDLKHSYWKAGIPEYWLVNGLSDPIRLEIYRYTRKGYVAARRQNEWVTSATFGRSFRIVQKKGPFDLPDYKLENR